MNIAAARGLHQRRASVIGWYHAQRPDPASLNPLTGGPHRSLGGSYDGKAQGPFGEGFSPKFNVRGYAKGKFSAATLQLWGMVQAGDMELVLLAPFKPDPQAGIVSLPPAIQDQYNAGNFAQMSPGQSVAFDRFEFLGSLWVAKAPAVPDVDNNTIFAWRMPVTKVTL